MRAVPGSACFELDNLSLSPSNALVSYLKGIVDEEGEKEQHQFPYQISTLARRL